MFNKIVPCILFVVIFAVEILGQVNLPEGWFRAGSRPQDYEMTIDRDIKHNGTASARIRFIGQNPEGFGTLMQTIKADAYRGKRVRMSAWVRSDGADSAQLWMRLDGPNGSMLGFDNMDNRKITGTTDWKKYEITLDVPDSAINLAFGAFVAGKGQAWVDDFAFEIVGKEVPTTNMTLDAPTQPANLSFEK